MNGLSEKVFRSALKSRRKSLKVKPKTYKPKRWMFPTAIERQYRKFGQDQVMGPIVDFIETLVQEFFQGFRVDSSLIPESLQIDPFLREYEDIRTELETLYILKDGNIRLDGIPEDMTDFYSAMQEYLSSLFGTPVEGILTSGFIYQGILKIRDSLDDFNKTQFGKQTEQVLGYPFVGDESWKDTAMKQWADDNYRYFQRYGREYADKVMGIIQRSDISSAEGIRLAQEELTKVGQSYRMMKPKLLARDQIASLNGLLSKGRMEDIGMTFYVWMTAKDERVRGNPSGRYPKAIPSHWVMEGKICRWDDSGVYSDPGDTLNFVPRTGEMPQVIPGAAILCRCTAAAYWNELIAEIDREVV